MRIALAIVLIVFIIGMFLATGLLIVNEISRNVAFSLAPFVEYGIL